MKLVLKILGGVFQEKPVSWDSQKTGGVFKLRLSAISERCRLSSE
jgi:hypothetical protein